MSGVAVPEDDRIRALACVLAHGRDATCFQALEPGLEYWFDGAGSAVAFAAIGRARVATGGPIAPLDREAEVMREFALRSRRDGRRVVWFAVERPPARDLGFARIHVGQEPVWDPRRWSEVLQMRRSLREQLRRARAKRVRVRVAAVAEIVDPSHPTRVGIEKLVRRWLARRRLAPMRFVVALEPFGFAEHRRYFVAEQDGVLCGVLVAVPVPARAGWLFEDVLRDPYAPNGTVEVMIDAAMRTLAAEGAREVTFGLAPLAEVQGRVLRWIRRLARAAYDFDGLFAFKAKLAPSAWRPVWVVWPEGRSAVFALLDVLRAFAGGSLIGFGWRTLLHRAPDVARLLAILLVPWMAAMATDSGWFPSRGVQTAWIAFDAGIAAALWRLGRAFGPSAARGLAILCALDCALGVVQFVAFNAPRLGGLHEAVIAVFAVAAPALVAVFLRSAASASGDGDLKPGPAPGRCRTRSDVP
ncbi:MAG: phosphatidylglycerol lysyltransferase domain-containing protein [Planctomycetota bacterium]